MGRKYDKIITFRVTENEREIFNVICKQNNLKSQELLRDFILKFIKENVVK